MNVLPKASEAVIPVEKFINYALDPVKSRGKSIAFSNALGYSKVNAYSLITNIKQNLANFEAIPKGDNGFGLKYEVIMNLSGINGKNANVLTGWIVEHESGITRLTTAYVTKRKVKND